ncbi:EF-hand domain-containing protein [Mesorhizobium sp. B1-1-8]|uniref:EF-hand domain-containing protein n=1 Tax=Mesorhizobium sp. B1-1-8 TaxID=2589976 RepID=UPI00112E13DB|nr:EF-hand domain-containing protein [Mesorhizobium sp. B1-1-8]UCI07585.1 acid-shock protein [Mesorhizobium sp. B1-1-8]
MICRSIFAAALGLLTAGAALAQITVPTPAPAPAPAAPSAPAADKHGLTLATFEMRREKAFTAADTDGDGKISLAEWTAFQTKRKGKGDPEKSFARMDANKDGFIDKSELDAVLAKRFARLDKNSDGMLSASERPGHKTAPDQEQ